MKSLIVLLALMSTLSPAQAQAPASDSDTMLVPRGREAYEQHLAELNARYGADKSSSGLKQQVLKANEAPSATQAGPGPNRLALPANIAPGQKLRIELMPHGDRDFRFQDQVFDVNSLTQALGNVQRGYVIEQIVLLTESDNPIQLDHLLELGRIGRELAVPTSYQQGNQLKLITTE